MMRLVYPKHGHETYEASTFLMGSVFLYADQPAQLFINNKLIDLSASGFFSCKVELVEGENFVVCELQDMAGNILSSETRTVIRHFAMSALPALPLQVSLEQCHPQGNIALLPGGVLEVSVLASPECQVTFFIPEVTRAPVPLHARSEKPDYLDNRMGIFGQLHQRTPKIPANCWYQAMVQIPESTPALQQVPLKVRLEKPSSGHTESFLLNGTLTILECPFPVIVRVDEAILRTTPEVGGRFTPQLKGTPLWITGYRSASETLTTLSGNDWLQVSLSPSGRGPYGYIQYKETEPARNFQNGVVPLYSVHTQATARASTESIIFFLSDKRPFNITVEETSECKTHLKLSLFGVVSCCDFIKYPEDQTLIDRIDWQQVGSDEVCFTVQLIRPLVGYKAEFTSQGFTLHIKTLPTPWQNTVICLDAGHGGSELGAIGLEGTPEKTFNLQLVQKIGTALRALGLTVTYTRTMDETISLPERVERAFNTANAADILLSIHHNALPDGRNPQQERGISTYYYQPFCKALAHHLLKDLAAMLPIPGYGFLYDSLFLTRPTQGLCILLEAGFVTHPEDYEQIVSSSFQDSFAQTVAKSLKQYLLQKPYKIGW